MCCAVWMLAGLASSLEPHQDKLWLLHKAGLSPEYQLNDLGESSDPPEEKANKVEPSLPPLFEKKATPTSVSGVRSEMKKEVNAEMQHAKERIAKKTSEVEASAQGQVEVVKMEMKDAETSAEKADLENDIDRIKIDARKAIVKDAAAIKKKEAKVLTGIEKKASGQESHLDEEQAKTELKKVVREAAHEKQSAPQKSQPKAHSESQQSADEDAAPASESKEQKQELRNSVNKSVKSMDKVGTKELGHAVNMNTREDVAEFDMQEESAKNANNALQKKLAKETAKEEKAEERADSPTVAMPKAPEVKPASHPAARTVEPVDDENAGFGLKVAAEERKISKLKLAAESDEGKVVREKDEVKQLRAVIAKIETAQDESSSIAQDLLKANP